MRLVVTGSIATDHLMTFPGLFADSLVAEKLHAVSLSFLVDELNIRRGGTAANIAFALGRLGLRPVLLGSVGPDAGDYRSWLEAHGVDCGALHVSSAAHTARFVCTTDQAGNQIGSFYPGAMSEDRDLQLRPVEQALGGIDLVHVGATDPEAMLSFTDQCRAQGYPFVSDPSQQLVRLPRDEIRRLVEGAAYLFSNEYEAALIEKKTGWSSDDVLGRVGVRVTTLGAKGAIVERKGERTLRVGAPAERVKADPTGVGDAFRAGFLAGTAWGLDDERCAQLGAVLATGVVETVGTQEYDLEAPALLRRFETAYGSAARSEVEDHLTRALAGAGAGA